MAEKLSNVIGAPFPRYVLQQLYIRAARNSTSKRSIDEVLFLANKTAWVRVISSVNIDLGENTSKDELTKFYAGLGLGSGYNTPADLAKNWVLEAGLSKAFEQSIQLRYGIGDDGAYGIGGIEEMGYRPMPGLISATIESAGTLGSLRTANITFKVWNMEQLNIIEALYFRLGYSMLIEWGHTQYYANPVDEKATEGGTFQTVAQTFGIDDPFADGVNKVLIQQKISRKSQQSSGNYDGMLGIVSNFNWSFNQEGGYDCNLKIIGLGSVIDSLRVNQSYKMPPGLIKAYKVAQENILKQLQANAARIAELERKAREKEIADAVAKQTAGLGGPSLPPPKIPKNFDELYQYAKEFGGLNNTIKADEFKKNTIVYGGFPRQTVVATAPFYLYLATGANSDQNNAQSFGLFNFGSKDWEQLPKNIGTTTGGQGASFYLNVDLLNTIGRFEYENPNPNKLQSYEIPKIKKLYEEFQTAGLYKNDFVRYISTYADPSINRLSVSTQGNFLELIYERPVVNTDLLKDFNFKFTEIVEEKGYKPNRQDKQNALDAWFTGTQGDVNSRLVFLTDLSLDDPTFRKSEFKDAVIKGNTTSYIIKDPNDASKTAVIYWKIEFDNPYLIQKVNTLPPVQQPTQGQAGGAGDSGNSSNTINQASTTQTDSSEGYESALHVMLSYIKTIGLSKGVTGKYGSQKVVPLDAEVLEATKTFYQDGIFKNVFDPPSIPSDLGIFNLTFLAQKGFNSSIMVDLLRRPDLAKEVDFVDFTDLCKAYLVLYEQSGNPETEIDYMVYIKFGYLLAFLNNMCLIYDSTQKTGNSTSPTGADKTPYVYIDFNPSTNFCLTSPQHLSIDPTICLIPLQSSQDQYNYIFPEDILPNVTGLFDVKTQNYLSGQVPGFQTNNAYQGKTMNILLNVDYLLRTANRFITNDKDNSLNLKDFLDQIVVDVNKSLGNINLFRVAYKDESNTVQIKDDQFVPKIENEPSILESRLQFFSATGGPLIGQLPIFGKESLARSFQFKTNISTKLASMIAISAQAATGSRNATDHSSLSYLNQNYRDRFKPYILESSPKPSSDASNQTNNQTSNQTNQKKNNQLDNNDVKIANTFNQLVKEIYGSQQLDITKIESAKNYYVERMSKVKSVSTVTTSAPFIPADLELTIDGIAGITMGNAFTIPEDRLPMTLRGQSDERPKVGFIVTGLSHTIQDNQWLTNIKGQMIRMRDNVSYPAQAQIAVIKSSIAGSQNTDEGCKTSYPNLQILDSIQSTSIKRTEVIEKIKNLYPNVGVSLFAILYAETAKSGGGENFVSAGNYNHAGVQTDSGQWGFGNFNGQFCRRDNSGRNRMFASFPSFDDFLGFMANRIKAKGFTATMSGDEWTTLYINSWWSPSEKAEYVKGTAKYNEKLSIYETATRLYNKA